MDTSDKRDWKSNLEILFAELMAAEKVYGTLVTADRYPHKRDYFKHRHFQYTTFAKILKDEYFAITDRQPAANAGDDYNRIFRPTEELLLERPMTDTEADALIVKVEKRLITKYQELLSFNELPNTTNAILQSQAEELNNEWQKLKTNLQIKVHEDSKSL